jgi:hypothetical protein
MSWLWPFSGPQKKTKPDEPMVAANDPALRAHFEASDAELSNLGFGSWRDALPAIKALAWESRELGDCLIYFPNGKKVPKSVSWMEVGPIRVRRKAKVYSVDDWD